MVIPPHVFSHCRIMGWLITYHDDKDLPSVLPDHEKWEGEQVTLQNVRKDSPTTETPPIAIKDVEL